MERHGFLLWGFVSQSKFSNAQPVQEKVSLFFKKLRPEQHVCKRERNGSACGLVGEVNLFFLVHLVYSLKIYYLTHGSLIRVWLIKNWLLISFLRFH